MSRSPRQPSLFVGVTSWNSEFLLETCLGSIRSTTDERNTKITVLDNMSTDRSPEIALSYGADLLRRKCGLSHALQDLFNRSRADYTLMIHSDVVLLSPNWLDLGRRFLDEDTILVSPEDIGCGPYTRPWGKGMPESSFMLFRTAPARSLRKTFWRRQFRLSIPRRALDFTGAHITYNLPLDLSHHGFSWHMMTVHTSLRRETPIYIPDFEATRWKPEFAMYEYGLGNFYSLDGEITHYHNWYERELADIDPASTECLAIESGGFPRAFLKTYTMRFLEDYRDGKLKSPEVSNSTAS